MQNVCILVNFSADLKLFSKLEGQTCLQDHLIMQPQITLNHFRFNFVNIWFTDAQLTYQIISLFEKENLAKYFQVEERIPLVDGQDK